MIREYVFILVSLDYRIGKLFSVLIQACCILPVYGDNRFYNFPVLVPLKGRTVTAVVNV